MFIKRTNLFTFALITAFCVAPFISISARAQEPAKEEPKQEEHEKKSTSDRKNEKANKDSSRSDEAKSKQDREKERSASAEPERRAQSRGGNAGASRAQANAHYHFRSEDKPKLRQHFQAQLAQVNRANRPQISSGTVIETTYRTYIQPVPQEVVVLLAPPPPAFVFGFWYGYIIVYDPTSFLVIDYIDLL